MDSCAGQQSNSKNKYYMTTASENCDYSPYWKLWLMDAPGRVFCVLFHLMGVDPEETRLARLLRSWSFDGR